MANPYLTAEDIKRLRAARIPVPESIEDLRRMLEEAEKDPRALSLNEAFREIRARLKSKVGTRKSA